MSDSLQYVDRIDRRLSRYLPPTGSTTPTDPGRLTRFIATSPGLDPPTHLAPLVALFERIAKGEQVKALVSTPPQHGKSQTALHALVWLLLKNPARRHAYATYAQAFSRDQSLLAQRIAAHHSLPLERDTLDRWATPAGGGVVWTSRGGPLTGHPVDGALIIDDLLKDREEANSQLIREKAMGWLSGVGFTRMHPGASIILIATRWHLDDPTGRLLERGGWEHVKLPAINESGDALWPEHRPVEWLEEQKANLLPADWSALYMCEPIADGSRVFGPTTYYDALPEGGYREAHGFDAAYTTKTTSDYTVTLTGRLYGEKVFLTNLLRARAEPREYIPLMLANEARHVHWYASSTERGLAELLKREGIRVTLLPTVTDKLARAIPAATAWNRGDILTPKTAAWTPALESELSQFTGAGDAHDDIVDALAALHHALIGNRKTDLTEARRKAGLA
jgi:predicted phage terminase large subunit-like protein